MLLDLLRGVRLQGNPINMNAAGVANAFTIFQVSNWANQVGTRTYRLKRVKGYNNAGADTLVFIGTGVGAAFVQLLPELYTIVTMNFDFVENDLPDVEFNIDLTAYPVAATVRIQVEVEVVG